MDATEYAFPCFFLGDPNRPPTTSPGPLTPRMLLGLSGVVNQIRISFDGTPAGVGAAYGLMIVEKL